MTYRCDYCHHQIYADRHFCPRFPSGGDQYAPGGLGTPEITEEQATAKSRELAMAQRVEMQIVTSILEPAQLSFPPKPEPEKVDPTDPADQTRFTLTPDQMKEFLAVLEAPAVEKPRLHNLLSEPSVLEQDQTLASPAVPADAPTTTTVASEHSSSMSISDSLSEIDRILAQGKDTSPKA